MPLDTLSTYHITHLRTDGRRWNELRRLTSSLSTQPSADGSSLFTQGNSLVTCTISGPREARSGAQRDSTQAIIETELTIAPFAQTDRRKFGKNDKRMVELQTAISRAFQTHCFTHLYPRSEIRIALHVLSLDGGLLSCCLNAASLALVDAGVPMPSLLAACTSGLVINPDQDASANSNAPPEGILDLNNSEELELPFLTVATVSGTEGGEDRVSVLMMESRIPGTRLEQMLAVGVDGCHSVRGRIEAEIRNTGARMLAGGKG
jgi:exosome complex component RRP41